MITMANRVEIAGKMQRVERAIRLTERRIVIGRGLSCGSLTEPEIFFSQGPRTAIYESSNLAQLLDHHEELGLPAELHYASFGAGLGLDSFLAAMLFRRVTGFEIDPQLADLAEMIRSSFGFDNVRFRRMDFLDLTKQELGEFGVIYLYRPFGDDFSRLTGQKLLQTRPETIVISHSFYSQQLFPEEHFRPIFPANLRVDGPIIYSPFYTFKRI
jgi:protein-L-isoaspartate O-methyltransferase